MAWFKFFGSRQILIVYGLVTTTILLIHAKGSIALVIVIFTSSRRVCDEVNVGVAEHLDQSLSLRFQCDLSH